MIDSARARGQRGETMLRDHAQRWLHRTQPGRVSQALGRATILVAARRAAIARPTARVPTIVVGGLSVGGAGKTPVVEWLARRAHLGGQRVAVVGHGYGGRARTPTRVATPNARAYGDEAAALRRTLPRDIAVWVGPRRATVAAASRAADVVLVDGGFQDPTCPRTFDLVVVDATDSRHVLPAGPLREPVEALRRADLVWAHRVDEPRARPLDAAVRSRVVASVLEGPDGASASPETLRGRTVVPVCGIARPSSFLHTLAALGARMEPGLVRADHHRFRPGELPPGPVVTTTKDRERLPAGYPASILHTTLEVEGARALDEALGW